MTLGNLVPRWLMALPLALLAFEAEASVTYEFVSTSNVEGRISVDDSKVPSGLCVSLDCIDDFHFRFSLDPAEIVFDYSSFPGPNGLLIENGEISSFSFDAGVGPDAVTGDDTIASAGLFSFGDPSFVTLELGFDDRLSQELSFDGQWRRVPAPPAVWLVASGLVVLGAAARRRGAKTSA